VVVVSSTVVVGASVVVGGSVVVGAAVVGGAPVVPGAAVVAGAPGGGVVAGAPGGGVVAGAPGGGVGAGVPSPGPGKPPPGTVVAPRRTVVVGPFPGGGSTSEEPVVVDGPMVAVVGTADPLNRVVEVVVIVDSTATRDAPTGSSGPDTTSVVAFADAATPTIIPTYTTVLAAPASRR
jgi:hypothetical protein